jgi:anti-sigma factor RsiW
MTCREFADFIMSYLSGDLAPEVRDDFEHHLSRCANCVSYLATYQAAVQVGRAALADPEAGEVADVPEELVQAILDARRR